MIVICVYMFNACGGVKPDDKVSLNDVRVTGDETLLSHT